MISVDTIGLPGDVTRELATAIMDAHRVDRERIVFCSTHTHAGPDLISELTNIFEKPLSDDEVAAGLRYKAQLKSGILQSAKLAIQDTAPAKFAYSVGNATFAANRRVLKVGRWNGFGVQADGVVDHTVPVLRITDREGKLRGVIFNYACHCTTIDGNYYRINSDLRAGSDRGRIYRIRKRGAQAEPMRKFDQLSIEQLVAQLMSSNGARRDLAQQCLSVGVGPSNC